MPTRRLAGALLLLVALTGCAGTVTPVVTPTSFDLSAVDLDDLDRNGIEFLPGPEAMAEVIGAARAAGSVTVVGRFDERLPPPEGERDYIAGLTLTSEVRGTSDDYSATLTAGDLVGEIRVRDDVVAATGNDAFLASLAAEDGCLSTTALDSWMTVIDPIAMLESLLVATEGSPVVVSTGAVVDGTIELVISSSGGAIGTLLVAASGPPVPILLTAADSSGAGTFEFTGWGEEIALPEPDC
jgi:hypothetical protein